MNQCPKISIIVPIYKTEQYLQRCIDSILAQTFTNFELLLIEDGSPDNSGKICDKYALKDSRIKVYHKENGGVSSARNLGLDTWQDCKFIEEFLLIFYFRNEQNPPSAARCDHLYPQGDRSSGR